MGVTIHFEGRVRDEAAYASVVQCARDFAKREGWEVTEINETETRLKRFRDGQDGEYVGPSRGLSLQPHEECEPLRLEFDRDLEVDEHVKTQFAPLEIHAKIVGLLHTLQPEFATFRVRDEGDFWRTGDLKTLARHVQHCNRALEHELAKDPGAKGPVRLPTGRIVDFVS